MIDLWRILNAVVLIKAQKPYLRVGQIIANAAPDAFYLTDDKLADALEVMSRGDR